MTSPNEKIDMLFWTTLAAAMLLVILFFGLRPKGMRFENAVRPIPEKGAIAFGKNGIAYVDDVSIARNSNPVNELTIEMPVLAGDVSRRGFGSLLMMHDGSDRRQLIVGQWESAMQYTSSTTYLVAGHRRSLILSVRGMLT